MKHILFVLVVVFIPRLSMGLQEYFSTDTFTSVGIKLVNGGALVNTKYCQVENGNQIIKYTPDEVNEYGFKNERVYVSKEIQIADSAKRVFKERLLRGKAALYYYKDKGVRT